MEFIFEFHMAFHPSFKQNHHAWLVCSKKLSEVSFEGIIMAPLVFQTIKLVGRFMRGRWGGGCRVFRLFFTGNWLPLRVGLITTTYLAKALFIAGRRSNEHFVSATGQLRMYFLSSLREYHKACVSES